MVTDAGYTGDVEVEIFNADIWAASGETVIATMIDRYGDLILPHLARQQTTPDTS